MVTLLWVILGLMIVYALYAFLPAFLSRAFGFRVFRRGRAEREIALTFDDGPDPEYTPRLLDLLKRHGAKATFFVVGENAERHPELIARMHEEGHALGIHNYVHHTNWLMRPSTVKSHIRRTSEAIERAAGVKPRYYRPPWGIMNAFDYRSVGDLTVVLWSAMFGDWSAKVGADKLYERMRSKLKPGEVMLMHDCGTTFGADRDAPANTIAALARLLEDGDRLGYKFVGIDQLIKATAARKKIGWLKKTVVKLWMQYEKLFHVLFRLRPIADGRSFSYRVRKYAGPTLDLKGAEPLKSGDYVMELHFDNQMLFDAGMNAKSELALGIKIIREVERMLPDAAKELSTAPNGNEIKALYGVSMINRGAEPLGYQLFDLPRGMFAWSTNWYLSFLTRVIRPEGNAGKSDRSEPRMLVMPRETLLLWANDPEPKKKIRESLQR